MRALACQALAMYELIECPAEREYNYISHHKGYARIIQVRGPKAHTSGSGHQIFLIQLIYRIKFRQRRCGKIYQRDRYTCYSTISHGHPTYSTRYIGCKVCNPNRYCREHYQPYNNARSWKPSCNSSRTNWKVVPRVPCTGHSSREMTTRLTSSK